jgi:hypothetical protein
MTGRLLRAACLALIALPACTGTTGMPAGHDPDAGDGPGPDEPDAEPSPETPDAAPVPDAPPGDDCGDWVVGTLTGYNNRDSGDDPNAGSVMEFSGLGPDFYDHVDMAAVDMSDWGSDKYHWIDVNWNGQVRRVGVWDACRNEDCPDGNQCCTENKTRFATPGYLVDVESTTAQRLWGVADAENTLQDRIELRLCGRFDPDAIAEAHGAYRTE